MTVSDLAAVVGVSRPTIHSWIRGEVAVPQDEGTARRLRALYELEMAWRRSSPVPVGQLLRVSVDGGTSLLDLLAQNSSNRAEIERALDAIHTRLTASGESGESAEVLAQENRLQDVAAQRARLRSTLQRARGLRR
jgi:transcriptional regulator with XRE-family HTH domain